MRSLRRAKPGDSASGPVKAMSVAATRVRGPGSTFTVMDRGAGPPGVSSRAMVRVGLK